jgi:hypothetical protein
MIYFIHPLFIGENMLFKVGVFIVCGFAIFTLFSAIYAHISYALLKIDEERNNL